MANALFVEELKQTKTLFLKKIYEIINHATEQIDISINATFLNNYSDKKGLFASLEGAYKRGIKIRLITKLENEYISSIKEFLAVSSVRVSSHFIDLFVASEK